MWSIKRQITEALDRFNDSELQQLFEYLSVLKHADKPLVLGQPLWSKVPTPLFRQFQGTEYWVAQDSSSGMSAILGKWPGEGK